MNQGLSLLERFAAPLYRLLAGFISEPRRILLEGTRPGEKPSLRSRAILTTWLLLKAIWESDVTVRAAATAYTFVFSMIPLLTTSLAFFTAFPSLVDERKNLERALFSYLLPGAVKGVQSYLEGFSEAAAAAGAVSTLVFFVSVLLLFQSLEGTYNRIWRASRARTWGERLQVLALFFLTGALGATLMVAIGNELKSLSERVDALNLGGLGPMLTQAGLVAGNLVTAWAVFVVANKVLPKIKVHWSAAITGGIVAGTLWHFLKFGFTWYITTFASYENLYGAVGTVPVFFLWLYLTILLLLISAYLAFITQNLSALLTLERAAAGGKQRSAWHTVAAAALLAADFRARTGPTTAARLAQRLGADPYFVAEALSGLARAGIALAVGGRTEQPRYILSVPDASVTVGELVRVATGENLELPSLADPSPLHQEIARLFKEASQHEHSPLEQTRLDQLVAHAPAASGPSPAEADEV